MTGDLEHPNIVPIYDLGEDDTGMLFYSMKRVKGIPWDKVIGQKSFDENLEIWMKVADAVGFAHSRGVVHRDIKPENVMLGDFGEVLLMDWGLAIVLHSPSANKAGMAGTPAYMPPEMAIGTGDARGPASDIYLMGAILYEIITGHARRIPDPRSRACLLAAAQNEIQPSPRSGELVDIALKAMAAEPEDRYASMVDFQEAIRQYRSHRRAFPFRPAPTTTCGLRPAGKTTIVRAGLVRFSGGLCAVGGQRPGEGRAFSKRLWPTPRVP